MWSILHPSKCMVFRRCTFSVVGTCELQNNIIQGSTSPNHCLQRPLDSLNCTASVAISKHFITGPFWFEDDNEHCVTTNRDLYVLVLRKFQTSLGQQKEVVRVRQWFQKYGATPKTSKESLAWINQRFSDRLISRKCDPQWSPDLNPTYFYLWGNIKDRVYVHNQQSIADLKR